MSLDKGIENGKERRRQWYDSRRIDSSCRNHGGCPWCEGNRFHQQQKLEQAMMSELREMNGTLNDIYDVIWQMHHGNPDE